jgi:threonine dehydratase
VKHENHLPTGAFKVRGGLVFMEAHRREGGGGIVTATRGNHGQSLAFAGRRAGVPVTIVVPHGNSREKNAAMTGYGATLIEHGADFDAARAHAGALARDCGLLLVPSFHSALVTGVATWALESSARTRWATPASMVSHSAEAITRGTRSSGNGRSTPPMSNVTPAWV